MTSGCTAGPIGPATTTNLVPGDSPTQRGGSRRNFAKKNRCPISGRPTDLLFSRRFFSPEAQSVTDPPNRFSELPFPFSRARHTIPPCPQHRGRLGKTAKPQSHILTPPFPTTKLRPSITPTRRVDDRPTSGDCAFAPRLCLSPSSRLRLAGWDWPAQPNLGQIGVRLGHLSISSQSPHMHWRATSLLSSLEGQRGRGARTKEKKGVEETVAGSRLGGQLVLLLFLFWPVSSSYTPPICLFCCCIIVPTLSFSGSAGGQHRGTDSSRLLLLAGWDDGIYPLFWTWFG